MKKPLRCLLLVIFMGSLTGCSLSHLLFPVQPPADLKPSPRQPGHFISHIEPVLVTNINLGIIRYLRWEGRESFSSFSICPFGYPDKPGEKNKCFHAYGGVKVDGTETLVLRQMLGDPTVYDYVYTHLEQAAFRVHGVAGEPDWKDMGGG